MVKLFSCESCDSDMSVCFVDNLANVNGLEK